MSWLRRVTARFPTVVLARRNLSRATARTTLAVVAIVIGVVAIGTIGAGGEAFKQDQMEAYEGFGGTATVSPVYYQNDDGDIVGGISDKDVSRMRQVTSGATVHPVIERWDTVVRTSSGETSPSAQVKGLAALGTFYEAQSGSIPDSWRQQVVVGSRFADNNDVETGDQLTVTINGSFERTFRVAAVLEPQGFADQLQADRSVFLPFDRLSQLEDSDSKYGSVIVRVDPQTGSIDEAAESLETEFNTRRRTIAVLGVQEQRERFSQTFEMINQFLIGVGSISLLVAAVTIANTMLMTAIEREREIGVMRAVGYPKRAVVSLLLAEATILGLVGAAIGVPLALGIGMGLNQFLVGDPLAFTAAGLRYVGLGALFGVLTSLFAGVYPAWKSANKRPVEALE
ncbi:ABC transporter permease [Haloferax sp. Atlit-10N]|uniref:ABC transporter permease n=1 Tax=unclassified Haloferax TaxID=2625095 RepID=UPI000E256B56|nr:MULTISPECIES: FtsX-like permease family protein [unclassified Haloferax]RDZ39901.1 ABC transporter permease [Haloferax sp. Atlit-16N]RDZ56573.1 ABC transporter permease [Haloferax sp. Atlit-10N]